MQQSVWMYGLVGVGVAILVAAGLLFGLPARTSTSTGTNATSTATTSVGGAGITTTGGQVTVSLVSNTGVSVPPPSLTRPITIDPNLPPDAQKILRDGEQNFITQLKADPTRVDLWLLLGTDRKIAGDYEGAALAWTYVAAVSPAPYNYTAHGNLGDLYLNFLHDFALAKADYQAAVALEPHNQDYVNGLAAAQAHLK
ncbi:MAG: hypothetical protein KGI70_01000 [Patescibacteria group bacterium]|nr:hypothetical protein [Patescibacteria group bacterium]